jgi:hypothetical protein
MPVWRGHPLHRRLDVLVQAEQIRVIAGGVRVKTIQVLFDGRYAHAFPIAP